MSHRNEQLASVIHRAVQSVLSEGLSDPRLQAMLTVTNVKVTDDLQNVTIFVSVLPNAKESLAIHGLRAAAKHIRRKTGDLVALHRLPEFSFKLDKGAKHEQAVLRALAEVEAERSAAPNRTQSPSLDESQARHHSETQPESSS